MGPMGYIMRSLALVANLAPVLLPRLLELARGVTGIDEQELMKYDEFVAVMKETQANVKDFDDPIGQK